jgi:hypothetical protein
MAWPERIRPGLSRIWGPVIDRKEKAVSAGMGANRLKFLVPLKGT